MLKQLLQRIKHIWHIIRRLSGDDAYEQYLQHHTAFHVSHIDAPAALTRAEFFKYWQEDKWKGMKRCC